MDKSSLHLGRHGLRRLFAAALAVFLLACGVRQRPSSGETLVPTLLPPTFPPGPSECVTPVSPSPTPVTPQAGATKVLREAGITLVYVPAGEFLMGSTDAEVDEAVALCQKYQSNCDRSWFTAEQPQHRVYLDGYWIGQTEVTSAQYRSFIEAGGYTNRKYWSEEGWRWKETNQALEPQYWNEEPWSRADYPVVGVSWYEAAAFAAWAGARLPTEAEWEKAARGIDASTWPWGEEWDGGRANFCDTNCEYDWKDGAADDGYRYTSPVGNYGSGASLYGALDLAGNVWEWVADWYREEYSPEGVVSRNPTGVGSGTHRVLRGGSWNFAPYALRCTTRARLEPSNSSSALGFRFVVPDLGL
jgi:formylglycine-generating enzyme required for sulfatase activity